MVWAHPYPPRSSDPSSWSSDHEGNPALTLRGRPRRDRDLAAAAPSDTDFASAMLAMLNAVARLPDHRSVPTYCASFIAALPGVEAVDIVFDPDSAALAPALKPLGTDRIAIAAPDRCFGRCDIVFDHADPRWRSRLADLRQALDLLALTLADAAQRSEFAARTSDAITQFRLVAENAKDAFIVADQTGSIEWVNRAFSAITGYPADRVIGRKADAILTTPGTLEAVTMATRHALRQRAPVTIELVEQSADGRTYWVELTISPIPARDRWPAKFISVARDITNRRLAEDALRREKERAESADRAKASFIAVMSHELRTPLNAIQGFGELVAAKLEPNSKLQEYQSYILSSARSLTSLLTDILDLSRISAGSVDLAPSTFELHAFLGDLVAMHHLTAEARGIALEIVAPVTPCRIVMDEQRLRQILHNLIANAIKFTRKGSVVADLSLSGEKPGPAVLTIAVHDSGIGIPAEMQEQIFEPFTQVESAYTRQYHGAGLGLAIVKRLIDAMQGSITLTSTPGIGSTFTVMLPVSRSA